MEVLLTLDPVFTTWVLFFAIAADSFASSPWIDSNGEPLSNPPRPVFGVAWPSIALSDPLFVDILLSLDCNFCFDEDPLVSVESFSDFKSAVPLIMLEPDCPIVGAPCSVPGLIACSLSSLILLLSNGGASEPPFSMVTKLVRTLDRGRESVLSSEVVGDLLLDGGEL